MRKILLLISVAVIVYASCKKDAVEGLNYYAYAEKSDNTSFKSALPNAYYRSTVKRDTLYLGGSSGEDHIVIRVVNNGVGTYQSQSIDAVLSVTLGQDVQIAKYHLNNDPGNIVKITNISNDVVEGTFDLTLKEIITGSTATPRVLTFSNGRFRMPISTKPMNFEPSFK